MTYSEICLEIVGGLFLFFIHAIVTNVNEEKKNSLVFEGMIFFKCV